MPGCSGSIVLNDYLYPFAICISVAFYHYTAILPLYVVHDSLAEGGYCLLHPCEIFEKNHCTKCFTKEIFKFRRTDENEKFYRNLKIILPRVSFGIPNICAIGRSACYVLLILTYYKYLLNTREYFIRLLEYFISLAKTFL